MQIHQRNLKILTFCLEVVNSVPVLFISYKIPSCTGLLVST